MRNWIVIFCCLIGLIVYSCKKKDNNDDENDSHVNTNPIAAYIVHPDSGNTNTQFYFDATNSTDLESQKLDLLVRWNFSSDSIWDTDWQSEKHIIHTFEDEGVYYPKLIVKDPGGLTDSVIHEVKVSRLITNTPPVAVLLCMPNIGTLDTVFIFNADASFDSESSQEELQVRWDVNGDGIWDTDWEFEKVLEYQYPEEGTYLARLEVRDPEELKSDTIATIVVEHVNQAPQAIFTIAPDTGTMQTEYQFDASGSYDLEDPSEMLQVRWDFTGDGVWDTDWTYEKSISKQYDIFGNISVKLEVRDTEFVSDDTIFMVEVLPMAGPCPGIPSFEYHDQIYNTVQIGDQCWMKENLNYKTPSSYCYNVEEENCDKYGRLYKWEAIISGEEINVGNKHRIRGICPPGWRLPDSDDWNSLISYLGGTLKAGGKLKEDGFINWEEPNTGASNISGFTALPGGYRQYIGVFEYINKFGYWWSTTENSTGRILIFRLCHNFNGVNSYYYYKSFGFSVRCIKTEI